MWEDFMRGNWPAVAVQATTSAVATGSSSAVATGSGPAAAVLATAAPAAAVLVTAAPAAAVLVTAGPGAHARAHMRERRVTGARKPALRAMLALALLRPAAFGAAAAAEQS